MKKVGVIQELVSLFLEITHRQIGVPHRWTSRPTGGMETWYFTRFGYIKDFLVYDPHKVGRTTVELLGRVNDFKALTYRQDLKAKEIEQYRLRMLPTRQWGYVVITTPNGVLDHEEAVRQNVKVSHLDTPRRNMGVPKRRDLSERVYASDEARAYALEKAEELVSNLDASFPILIRSMLPSHVTGECPQSGNLQRLLVNFCRKKLPRQDEVMTLVDEDGNEYPIVYLARKRGLSGGWKRFAVEHELVDSDAVVFQVIKHGVLKVHLIRANGLEEGKNEEN
ncbi:hypothetical protein Ancab_016940 [Ancistrocladus abbreviatus]